MPTVKIEATNDDSGMRLDVFLTKYLRALTRNAVQNLIENGSVYFKGTSFVKKNYKINGNEFFHIDIQPPRECKAIPQDIEISVVFEDNDIIIVDKKQGMVVHPAAGNYDGTLVNALLAHCGGTLSGIGGEKRPGIVHRLDKDTSGLVIAAKNDEAHRSLSVQIKAHTFIRIYEAIIYGTPPEDNGIINLPVGRHKTNRKKMDVTEKNSKHALTHYEIIKKYNGYSHIRCRLETGRTHQIRVHMAHIGHPVVGDAVYGPKKNIFGQNGQCLHAKKIIFRHPASGEIMTFEAPLHDYFKKILARLEKI